MRKLILVNGDIATGKSHFSVLIRDKYHLPLFTKDEFKEEYAKTYPYSTYEESHLLSIKAMNKLFSCFEDLAKDGKDMILEANFRESHMPIIEELTKRYSYDVLHIDLVGSPQVLYKRYMNRLQNENRHPVHASNSFTEYSSFEQYILSRRNESRYGQLLIINADNFDYQKNPSIYLKIEEFLNK